MEVLFIQSNAISQEENQAFALWFQQIAQKFTSVGSTAQYNENLEKKLERASGDRAEYLKKLTENVGFLRECSDKDLDLLRDIFNSNLVKSDLGDAIRKIQEKYRKDPTNEKKWWDFYQDAFEKNGLTNLASQIEELEFAYIFNSAYSWMLMEFLAFAVSAEQFGRFKDFIYTKKPWPTYRSIIHEYLNQHSAIVSAQ